MAANNGLKKDIEYRNTQVNKLFSRKLIEEPKLVNFDLISIPDSVHMLHLIDFIPLFIYIELLIKKL